MQKGTGENQIQLIDFSIFITGYDIKFQIKPNTSTDYKHY